MTVEHHDLVHEFPEFRDQIHALKVNNAHFRRLFDEYHEVTTEVEKMENEVLTVSNETEEQAKYKRLHLKDQLYAMLVKEGSA